MAGGDDSLSSLLDPRYIAEQILLVHRQIRLGIERWSKRETRPPYTPGGPFEPIWRPSISKSMVNVDITAEQTILQELGQFHDVVAVGEETLSKGLDWTNEKRYCVLLDMVDGTDLMQRGFSNWCSAIVVFNPTRPRIEGAFVALSERTLYYATERSNGAFKIGLTLAAAKKGKSKPISLRVPPSTKGLRDAAVCMYAQKSRTLLGLLKLPEERPRFVKWLEENAALDKQRAAQGGIGFRFYNFAGNPMMVRLAEGVVDVVLEVAGQKAHDVVPGAYIALEAGAVLGHVHEHRLFTKEELARTLIRPADSSLSYILASTRELYSEFFELLKKSRKSAAGKRHMR